LGAVLELILIISNVGTAVVPYALFKRYSQSLALGYVAARLVECTFIAIGIISLLTFLFMRQEGTAGTDAALGEAFVAIYDRAFLIGPGFFAGVANGMILGYLMYRSGLVPRGMAMLGLIGGPLIVASGIAVMFDVIERGSALQGVATIPEFIKDDSGPSALGADFESAVAGKVLATGRRSVRVVPDAGPCLRAVRAGHRRAEALGTDGPSGSRARRDRRHHPGPRW
jgi:hypothetical protein